MKTLLLLLMFVVMMWSLKERAMWKFHYEMSNLCCKTLKKNMEGLK